VRERQLAPVERGSVFSDFHVDDCARTEQPELGLAQPLNLKSDGIQQWPRLNVCSAVLGERGGLERDFGAVVCNLDLAPSVPWRHRNKQYGKNNGQQGSAKTNSMSIQ
jgi:hypothetical protein